MVTRTSCQSLKNLGLIPAVSRTSVQQLDHIPIIGRVERTTQNGILVSRGDEALLVPRLYVKKSHLVKRGDVEIEVCEKWLLEHDKRDWII